MTRRGFVALFPAAALGQDADREQVIQVIRDASRALNAGNVGLFLKKFDKRATPNFSEIEANAVPLAELREIASSIQINELTGSGEAYDAKIDWLLQLTPQNGLGPVESRQRQVNVRLVKGKKRWRFTRFEPVDFLSPAAPETE